MSNRHNNITKIYTDFQYITETFHNSVLKYHLSCTITTYKLATKDSTVQVKTTIMVFQFLFNPIPSLPNNLPI